MRQHKRRQHKSTPRATNGRTIACARSDIACARVVQHPKILQQNVLDGTWADLRTCWASCRIRHTADRRPEPRSALHRPDPHSNISPPCKPRSLARIVPNEMEPPPLELPEAPLFDVSSTPLRSHYESGRPPHLPCHLCQVDQVCGLCTWCCAMNSLSY